MFRSLLLLRPLGSGTGRNPWRRTRSGPYAANFEPVLPTSDLTHPGSASWAMEVIDFTRRRR
jgi:hypothetical protein